ncbi:MAG: hypothetical protein OHK0052_26970 [Anaerolineales bacterium]
MQLRLIWKLALAVLLLLFIWWGISALFASIQQTVQQAVAPIGDTTGTLSTQVAQVLNPTPTILPSPQTIIHQVRPLARLETIQYSVEKVVTAQTGQGALAGLFGDKLLFVAHGTVIAGVDMAKLTPNDLWLQGDVLYVRLPEAEIFIAALDNEKSYVYDRETGLLTKGDVNLESAARRAAEQAIADAALEDGILALAQQNAETYLERLLRALGYPQVVFVRVTPTPQP